MTSAPNSLGLIALKPIPTTHSAGITLYQPITDENEILSHPEWPVYRDLEQAMARLNRSVQAPPYCTRVFSSSDLSFTVANRLGLQKWKYGSRLSSLIVTSTPFLVSKPDPKVLHDLLSTRFSHFPVFGLDLDDFLSANPAFTLLKSTDLWGCPAIALRRLTKDGRPVRTPAEAIARKRAAWNLLFCHPDLTRSFLHTFFEVLTTRAPTYSDAVSSLLGATNPSIRYCYFALDRFSGDLTRLYLTQWVPNARREPKTWSEHALVLSSNLRSLTNLINGLLRTRGHEKYHAGVLRSPLTFLFHRRRSRVIDALALFHPYLPYLRASHSSDPFKKLHSHDLHNITRNNHNLALALLRLSRAMGLRTYPNHPVAHLLSSEESRS